MKTPGLVSCHLVAGSRGTPIYLALPPPVKSNDPLCLPAPGFCPGSPVVGVGAHQSSPGAREVPPLGFLFLRVAASPWRSHSCSGPLVELTGRGGALPVVPVELWLAPPPRP